MNKKGGIEDLVYMMIILFMVAIGSFVGYKVFTEVNDNIQASDLFPTESKEVMNITSNDLSENNMLDYAFLALLVILTIFIFLLAYLNDFSPAFLILFIIVLIIATLIAVGLANAYYEFEMAPQFSEITADFPMQNYIMQHLPYYIFIIGIVFSIVIYAKWRSDNARF